MKRHPEQTSHKTACNTTQDRKIENKKMSKTRRILTLQNQKENRATGTKLYRMASQDKGRTHNIEAGKIKKPRKSIAI